MSLDASRLGVALLTPLFWPEVRRGTERAVHELAGELLARGHRPTVITSHRGKPERDIEQGVPVLRVPRAPEGRRRRRRIEQHVSHTPFSYAALRAGRYDVAHAWFSTDALVAGRWRRRTGGIAVQSYMGIPDLEGLRDRRRRLGITLRSIESCDVTVALSRYAAQAFRTWLGYDAPVINPPVDVRTFTPGGERTEQPTFICAASTTEPRKRIDLLVRAFARVRRDRPRARLLLNRPRSAAEAAQLVAAGPGIELVDMDDRAALAALYGSAWGSVLASTYEAFGLVLAEALACGTPGVGSDVGGIPEVLDRPGTGVLFNGAEAELARALLEVTEMAGDDSVRATCRARAEELSTERYAAAYEDLYAGLLTAADRGRRR